jgi:hypothetical protein
MGRNPMIYKRKEEDDDLFYESIKISQIDYSDMMREKTQRISAIKESV